MVHSEHLLNIDDLDGWLAEHSLTILEPEKHPVVMVKDVNFTYGKGESRVQVLFQNNLAIYPGEIVIMTGPSGSGKTTLLTLVGALRSLQDGSLMVLGQELRGLRPAQQVHVRRGIGFIFQQHNLFEALTAFQNVKIATQLHDYAPGKPALLAAQMLEAVQLGEHLHKKPHKLSGGQRQRVAIARALVNRPKFVIADEPTAALDKETGRLVVNILKDLARNHGAAVIIVTHDNRILDVADRIVKMVDGHIESDIDIGESMTVVSFLQKCPVFAKASSTMLADTAAKMRHEHFAPGETIIQQGDIGDKFYIVRSGQVDVIQAKDGEAPAVVARRGTGDFFGEVALLEEVPRSATIKGVERYSWKVATKAVCGMRGRCHKQLRQASGDRGLCRCTTSKRRSCNIRPSCRGTKGASVTRAPAPPEGIVSTVPESGSRYGGAGPMSDVGAMMKARTPRCRKLRAKCATWLFTPPGTA